MASDTRHVARAPGCGHYTKRWDDHDLCLRCRKDACGRADPCFVCSAWDSKLWNLRDLAIIEYERSDKVKFLLSTSTHVSITPHKKDLVSQNVVAKLVPGPHATTQVAGASGATSKGVGTVLDCRPKGPQCHDGCKSGVCLHGEESAPDSVGGQPSGSVVVKPPVASHPPLPVHPVNKAGDRQRGNRTDRASTPSSSRARVKTSDKSGRGFRDRYASPGGGRARYGYGKTQSNPYRLLPCSFGHAPLYRPGIRIAR